jgi:hypothetical protein
MKPSRAAWRLEWKGQSPQQAVWPNAFSVNDRDQRELKGSIVQTNRHGLNDEGDSRVFLNASELGKQLGLRKSRVYELAAQGLLPNVRLGRRIWFPVHGLDALAEAAIQESRNHVLSIDVYQPLPH